MKIILKYILNNIRDRKMRTGVMLLSILLSTTLLFVSLSISDSYAEAQRKMTRGMAGSATISLSSGLNTDGRQSWIDIHAVPDLSAIERIVGIVQTIGLYKEDGYYENVDIIAADLTELKTINKPRLLDGSDLSDFTGNQVILPDRFTSKYNIWPGDIITLYIGGDPYPFTVAGIAAYDTVFLRHTRGTNALVPVETLSAILGSGAGYSRILVKPADGATTDHLQTQLREVLPEQYHISQVVDEAQVEATAHQKSMPFFLISFFALTMSIFIICSSYKVITLERLPVIGTFRSIGATQKAVTNILMTESLIYGGLGALLGIPAGMMVLKVLLIGLGDSLSGGIDIPMMVSPRSVFVSSAVAVAVSAMSAWIPVRRASRLPVKDVVLGKSEEQALSNRILFLTGTVLMVVSIILPKIGENYGGSILYLTGGLSLVTLLVATIVLIPMVTTGIAAILERIYGLIPGNEGRLAARNMRGNKNVAQNITLLFISISAIIAINVVGDFVQVYIGDVFRGAELDGFTDAVMSPEMIDDIKGVEGIDEVMALQVINSEIIMPETGILGRVEGTADISRYAELFAMTCGNGQDLTVIGQSFHTGRNILLSYEIMAASGLKPGATVTLSSGDNIFNYTVLGSFKVRSTNTDAIIPSDCARNDFGVQNYGIAVFTAPDPEAVMVQIRQLFGSSYHWSRTVKEFNEDALGTVGAFLRPMQNLTWFILTLATVGIINNLLINHIQKRRAIAMYKSVGMSNRQNIMITLVEGFSAGLIGAVFAIVISWLELKTIFLVAGPQIAIQPELKISTFLIAGAMGIGITLIGSIIPILKSRNLNIVEELKFD